MPLKKNIVAYCKPVKLPNGKITLALFDKHDKLIEYRICEKDTKTKKFTCPKRQTDPEKRKKVAKKLGINPKTNQLLKK